MLIADRVQRVWSHPERLLEGVCSADSDLASDRNRERVKVIEDCLVRLEEVVGELDQRERVHLRVARERVALPRPAKEVRDRRDTDEGAVLVKFEMLSPGVDHEAFAVHDLSSLVGEDVETVVTRDRRPLEDGSDFL